MLRTMQKVVYSCPYVPAEWIAAHGLQPCRIMPSAISGAAQIEGLCPYAQAFMKEAISDSNACGIIVTTLCDQMRRAHDVISQESTVPVFLMNVPSMWQTVAVQRLYVDELRRLGRFLVRLGGHAPSNGDLADVMVEYDERRAELMMLQDGVSSRNTAQAIADFNRDGLSSSKVIKEPANKAVGGVPLAIVGGPLLSEHMAIFDILEKSGGRIVLDATETGARGMCGRFDSRSPHHDTLGELATAYFGTIPDASNRPNSRLYQWLREQLDLTGVQGIIFHRYLWCDIWHVELARVKEWAHMPVLDVNIGGHGEEVSASARQKIEAFLEMLR